jgi:hypothetical protein
MAGTRWVRLDVDYLQNPKIRALSKDARWLHLASILYTGSQLTDGQIADRSVTYVGQTADIAARWTRRRASELEAAGLWVPNDGGWTLHDFDVMNPQLIRENVERERARWRERQARWRKYRFDNVTP